MGAVVASLAKQHERPFRAAATVHEAFGSLDLLVVHNTGKGPKLGQFGDDAFHKLIDLILFVHQGPGIRLEPFEAQADATTISIHVQDIDLHFVAYL